ncbi:hypothetical protein H5T55_05785 [Candidatus Bipolaricaulota bacterium]|nr:hypothetical protein [Candidatus Bipolaricaulota bacterium]
MTKAFLSLVLVGFIAVAQQTPSFDLVVRGEKTWTIRLGWGASDLLGAEGLTPGQLALTQTLRAEIEGTALGFLTLRASFNDQLGPGFQDFLLTVDRTPWTGELGRFVVGAEGEGLGVYNKRVLGARVTYAGDGASLGAVVTRLEGVSETRTFTGERGEGEALFTTTDPDEPWREAPYGQSVEGLAYWPLSLQFVEGLSQVRLRLEGGMELWTFLAAWELGYIREDLEAERVMDLPAGQYLVLREEGEADALALRVAPAAIARRRIQDAIDAHNTRLGLTDDNRKAYPFVEGSELETRFLSELGRFLAVLVDEDAYPFSQAQRRRYLYLGEPDVIADTVEVWIRRPGETDFRPLPDPTLADFVWTLLPAPGVLRVSFPDTFFQGGAVQVGFAYQREGSTFALGLSLVPASDQVRRNGQLLTRGVDYAIDYESGLLILFSPLGPEEELKVDFERQRGGLGGYADYERDLLGLVLNVPGWDGFKLALYRAHDLGAPRPTTATMPNTHTVAALSLAGRIGEWTYRLAVGGSENVFPSDDNARIPTPNRINAIAAASAADGAYVVFGHQNGLTVYKDGLFTSYGTAHGLSGRAVHALLAVPDRLLVGTDAGLTIVRLVEATPFDRVRSWVRLFEDDGVPGTEVLALAHGGGRIYLATESDVASLLTADAETPDRWERLGLPEEGPRPTTLLWADERLYLGTEEGLFVREGEAWTLLPEAPGPVHALAARGEELYVASEEGIRIVRGGRGAGWIAPGQPVYGMAFHEGVLWYATGNGLWREGEAAPVAQAPIVAVGAAGGAVWAGEKADEAFTLHLWRVAATTERFPQTRTKLDGRDLARFQDIPAGEHTRYGAMGSLNLSRTLGDWQWELQAATRLPGYEEIGRAGRSDSHSLGFTARYVGDGPSSLAVSGRWNVADLLTEPAGKLSAALDWRWSGPVTITVSLTPTTIGTGLVPFAGVESGWRAGISGQSGALTWSVTTSGTGTCPEPSAAGQVGASLSFPPLQGWTVSGSWSRPFRTSGKPGDESIALTAKGTGEMGPIGWTATVQESLRHSLATGTWREERTVALTLRRGSRLVGPIEVTPRFSGSWKTTATEWRWSGQLSADLVQAPASLRLSVGVGQGYRPLTARSDRSLTLSMTWEHSGWGGIRPSMRWDRSWTLLSHPRYDDQLTEKEEATLRVTWEPAGAQWRDTFALVWKPREGSLAVTNRLSWPLESGSVTAEGGLTVKEGVIDAKATAQLGIPLDALLAALGRGPVGDAWGLSADATYALHLPAGAAPTQTLFVGATLAVRF